MNSFSASWSSMTSAIRRRWSRIFPDSWRRRKPQPLPLGLSPAKAQLLVDLRQQPGWAEFREAMEYLYHLKLFEMANGLTPEQYHAGQGYLRAIESVATLPDTLTTVMTRVQTDERKRQQPDDAGEHYFYGSPFYRPVAGAGRRPEGVGTGEDG